MPYDLDYVLKQGILKWSGPEYDDMSLTDANRRTLDPDTEDFLFNEIMDKLAKNIQTFGPVLANAGFSIEESAALFGKLNKAGVDASRVMPAINAATRKMAAEGITDLKGGLSKTIEAIRGATSTTEALNIATRIFGAEGAQRMTSAIREGGLSIEGLTEGLQFAAGSIGATARATETMGEKFSRMKNTVLVSLEPLLTGLFNGILAGLDKLTPIVRKFSDEQMPKIVAAVQAFARDAKPVVEAFLTAFVSGLEVLFPVVKGLFDFVISNKPVLIIAIADIGAAILLAFGPVSLAVAALVGIIAVIGLVKDNWQAIKDKLVGIGDQILGFFKNNWPEIATLISGPFAPLVLLATDAFGIRSALVDAFTKLPGQLLGGLGDMAHAGVSLATALGNGLIWGVEKAINLAIGTLNFLITKFNEAGAFGLDLNPFTTNTVERLDIPRLAQGTVSHRGGLAIVGERGPELVNLPRGSRVFSNGASQQMGATVVNQHFTFNGPTDMDAAEFIIETMGEEFRRGSFPYLQRAT